MAWRHAWRNALGPVIYAAHPVAADPGERVVFVEAVFAWPGLRVARRRRGRQSRLSAADGRVGAGGHVVVAASLMGDIAYALLDPRVRLS